MADGCHRHPLEQHRRRHFSGRFTIWYRAIPIHAVWWWSEPHVGIQEHLFGGSAELNSWKSRKANLPPEHPGQQKVLILHVILLFQVIYAIYNNKKVVAITTQQNKCFGEDSVFECLYYVVIMVDPLILFGGCQLGWAFLPCSHVCNSGHHLHLAKSQLII